MKISAFNQKIAAAVFVCAVMMLISTDSFSRAGSGQSYRSKSSSSKSSTYSSKKSSSSSSYSGSSRSSYSRPSSTAIVPVIIPSGGGSGSTTGSTAGTTTDASAGQTKKSGSDWIYGVIGLVIIILIIALVVFLIVKLVKKIFGLGGSGIKFDDTKPTEYEFDPSVLDQIKRTDPEFSPDLFMTKSQTIVERLQKAWSDNDMMSVRNYVSQGVYNRFRLQLQLMMEEENVRNVLSDFKVMKVSVIDVSISKNYQTLHVKMFSCAKDATVAANASVDDINSALGKKSKEAFYEIYSFTRKLGVKTNTSRDWLKGECPNCGYVPDNFSQSNKCESCGSIYNSGEYDWVLSEITQSEEWEETSASEIEGLSELEGSNMSVNRELIEDRASYLFWRWIYSRVKGSSAPLARDASPDILDSISGRKEPLFNTAVGAVDLLSVRTEGADAYADVRVEWSTAEAKDAEPYHHEHTFTLMMPIAQKNPYGLADHSCNSCGGPLPESDAVKCSYCGSELPVTVTDWLLAATEEVEWEEEYEDDDEYRD